MNYKYEQDNNPLRRVDPTPFPEHLKPADEFAHWIITNLLRPALNNPEHRQEFIDDETP